MHVVRGSCCAHRARMPWTTFGPAAQRLAGGVGSSRQSSRRSSRQVITPGKGPRPDEAAHPVCPSCRAGPGARLEISNSSLSARRGGAHIACTGQDQGDGPRSSRSRSQIPVAGRAPVFIVPAVPAAAVDGEAGFPAASLSVARPFRIPSNQAGLFLLLSSGEDQVPRLRLRRPDSRVARPERADQFRRLESRARTSGPGRNTTEHYGRDGARFGPVSSRRWIAYQIPARSERESRPGDRGQPLAGLE